MIKLLSCHVENFGKLSNLDIDFNSGLTEIVKENGYGKTTLATFLKVMFFGMKSTRTTDKEMGDRERYYPFSSQKFGGNLTFLKDGVTYRIERWFDKKSETGDTVKVYKNDTLLDDFSSLLGENLFEIDENAFKRTLFITAEQIEVGSNAKIASKLNSIVDDTNEEVNYDKAKENLEKEQKKYKASRGDGGLISQKQQEVSRLQIRIDDCNKIKEALNYKYEKLNLLQTQVDGLKEKVNKSNQIIADIKTFEHYDDLLRDASAKKQALENAKAVFVNGVPTEQKIIDLKEKEQAVLSQRAVVKALEDGDNVNAQFEELKRSFANGTPTDQDLNIAQNKIARLNELKMIAQSKPVNKMPILLALSTLPIIAGIVIMLFNLLVGGIVAGVGVIAVICSLLFAKNNKTVSSADEISKLKSELNAFFSRFGYSHENYEYIVSDIKHNLFYYSSMLSDFNRKQDQIAKEKAVLSGLENNILIAINALGFTINGNLKTTIYDIENKYNAIKIAKRSYEEGVAKAEEFKTVNNLNERPTESISDLEQILLDNELKTKEYAKLSQEIYEDEKQAEELEVLQIQLDSAKEDIKNYKKEYDIFTKTIAFLKKAEENLLERYVAPVKDRFSFYAKHLEKAINEKIHIDKDFNLSFEDYGEYHSQKHLSFGQMAMSNLCIRLALIDNMFSGNLPFVILDDPFIGLDENNFNNMKKLIKEISKDRQIIYFTCHDDRAIN